MNTNEFRTLIHETFENHTFSNDRTWHTVNELLYILEHDNRLKDFNFNISIESERRWYTIPALPCFVSNKLRAVEFYDNELEFEDEEWDGTHYHNITIHDKR